VSAPLSGQQLAEIRAQLGDGRPAADDLLVAVAEQIRACREHDHASAGPDWDWFCLNASGWLGDKVPAVLRRLLDAEAHAARYRVAWGMARTRARSAMSGADRYAARSRELQTALQECVFALLGMQMERDAARAEVERLRAERHETNEALDDAVKAIRAKDQRIAELESAEPTVWHAWYPDDAMSLGFYTGREAAMAHVHQVLADEENTTAAVIETRVIWRADDPNGPEGETTGWECWLVDADGEDDSPTGYVVTPITVAAAYDPDGES
jgi:hypothetical protein